MTPRYVTHCLTHGRWPDEDPGYDQGSGLPEMCRGKGCTFEARREEAATAERQAAIDKCARDMADTVGYTFADARYLIERALDVPGRNLREAMQHGHLATIAGTGLMDCGAPT